MEYHFLLNQSRILIHPEFRNLKETNDLYRLRVVLERFGIVLKCKKIKLVKKNLFLYCLKKIGLECPGKELGKPILAVTGNGFKGEDMIEL